MSPSRSYKAWVLFALASSAISNPILVVPDEQIAATPTSSVSCAAEIFSSLLSLADPRSLHRALHVAHPKYTDGAFETDQSAIKAVHKESPELATAILELARRQESNNTNAASQTTPQQQQTSVAVVTGSPTSVLVVQTSTQEAPTTQQAQTTVVQAPSSASPTVRTSLVAPPSSPSSAAAAAPSTSVVQQTSVVATTAQVSQPPSSSAQPVQTSSAAAAPQDSSSDDGGESVSTSLFLSTYTPPGGGPPSTITAVTVIGVPGRSGANAGQSTAADGQKATLQNAAAVTNPDSLLTGFMGMFAAALMAMVA